jgi:predicted DNA-binding antitoxin AbrB/MazE fold protein
MSITIEATYEDGVLKPVRPLPLKEHDKVAVTIETVASKESRGERLIREAREGHAQFAAGWRKFMEDLGIQGQPIGAKKLRAMLLEAGINPDENEFSREIIAMREE